MSTTENSDQILHSLDAAISRLSEEMRTQTDTARSDAREKLAALRAERDIMRLEVMADICTALVTTRAELATVTTEAARAAGEAKGKGQSRLDRLEVRLAQAKHDLQAHVEIVGQETDEEIAWLEEKSRTADAAARSKLASYRDRLKAASDLVARNARALAQAVGAKLEGAKRELEDSMRELTKLRNEGSAGHSG